MTLTLTAYDLSQEAKDWKAKIARMGGRIAQIKYHSDNSNVTLTAYVPEQPELLCPKEQTENTDTEK